MQATQRALNALGPAKPALALVFVSQEFAAGEVTAGIASLLGDTPLWGFTTLCPLTAEGDQPRSVVVALLTGSELNAQVHWLPDFAADSLGAARQALQAIEQETILPQAVLLAADGFNGSLEPVCAALSGLRVPVHGCTAAGEPSQGKTYQIGKNQSGAGGLSVACLGGNFRLGAGLARGWQDLGIYFRPTRADGAWLHELDGAPAVEMYAQFFGYPARDWANPPLNDMIRLYPLGVEKLPADEPEDEPAADQAVPADGSTAPFQTEADPAGLLIRSPLWVEPGGSLRMSAPVPEGSVAHLMAGDPSSCLRSARDAAAKALAALDGARPLLAVALVDAAWQLLFESNSGQITAALDDALIEAIGYEIPLVGAYTHGQIDRPDLSGPPVLHNQNLSLLILGAQ